MVLSSIWRCRFACSLEFFSCSFWDDDLLWNVFYSPFLKMEPSRGWHSLLFLFVGKNWSRTGGFGCVSAAFEGEGTFLVCSCEVPCLHSFGKSSYTWAPTTSEIREFTEISQTLTLLVSHMSLELLVDTPKSKFTLLHSNYLKSPKKIEQFSISPGTCLCSYWPWDWEQWLFYYFTLLMLLSVACASS